MNVVFSAISIWEIAIKTGRGRNDFRLHAGFFAADSSTMAIRSFR